MPLNHPSTILKLSTSQSKSIPNLSSNFKNQAEIACFLVLHLVSLCPTNKPIMTKRQKLIERLLSRPKDFSYDEARTILTSLGFEELNKGKTSGSRVLFANGNSTILLHKPHPSGILKPYQVRQIIETLQELNLL
jgi:hypothetical protein